MSEIKALRHALDFASRGLRVFPLRPYAKTPAISEWQHAATTDTDVIRAWWAANPEYNFGVCMTDWVGFDIDLKHIGEEALDNYRKAGGTFDTLSVITPTGGYHCYFRGPDSLTMAGVKPGVDIRSHHGYLVGPGSILDPVLGGDPKYVAGEYSIINDTDIADCPTRLLRVLREPHHRKVDIESGARADAAWGESEVSLNLAKDWLANEAEPSIQGHEGNNNAFKVACQVMVDYALSADTTIELMMEHWNDRCSPPWDKNELTLVVNNAAKYANGRTGFRTPSHMFGSVNVIAPTVREEPVAEEVVQSAPSWIDEEFGNAPFLEDIPDRPWLVDRLYMRGQVTVFGGEGSAGKSAISLTMAAHFAVGKDFGPYRLREPGVALRSAIYNAEDDVNEQGRRLHGVCIKYGLDFTEVRKNIKFLDPVNTGGSIIFAAIDPQTKEFSANTTLIESFCGFIEKHKVDLLMFDPLVNLHLCNENDSREMFQLMELFISIARRMDIAIVLAHHNAKGANQKSKGDQDSFRGSSAIINRCRIALIVSNAAEDEYRKFGISPKQNRVCRIDDAKANLYLKLEGAIAYFKWETVTLRAKELVGAAMVINTTSAEAARKKSVADFLYSYMTNVNVGCIARSEAVRALIASHPPDEGASDTALAKEIEIMFANPVPTADHGVSIVYSMVEGHKTPMFQILGRPMNPASVFA